MQPRQMNSCCDKINNEHSKQKMIGDTWVRGQGRETGFGTFNCFSWFWRGERKRSTNSNRQLLETTSTLLPSHSSSISKRNEEERLRGTRQSQGTVFKWLGGFRRERRREGRSKTIGEGGECRNPRESTSCYLVNDPFDLVGNT